MRGGADVVLERGDADEITHNAINVYGEMLRQVCRDYSSLPDVRSMTVDEIVWFYDALRGELRQATGPKKTG